MPLFGRPSAFPRPPGSSGQPGARRSNSGGGRSPSPSVGSGADKGGGGGDVSAGGKGSTGGVSGGGKGGAGAAGAPSVGEIIGRIARCQGHLTQLSEFLNMDQSDDLCPVVDSLIADAREEVAQMQQGGEVCMNEDRFDLVEQISAVATEFDAVQSRANAWKAGRGGGGGGHGRIEAVSDDERMARELAAQFAEEDRASSGGTPTAASIGGSAAAPVALGPSASAVGCAGSCSPAPSPALSSAALAWDQPLDFEPADPGLARKKEKKKKKEARAAEAFSASDIGAGSGGGGWPDGGAADAGEGSFPADFGAFRSAPAADFPSMDSGGGGDAFADFGAFGSTSGGFPAASAPPPAPTFGDAPEGDFAAFGGGGFKSPAPASAIAEPTPVFDLGSIGGWSGPPTNRSHSSSPMISAVGLEPATMQIRRPYAEIADDVQGFSAHFANSIAAAVGIPAHRIRVREVRPG